MEEYNQMDENGASRGNFLYSSQSIGGNYGRSNHDGSNPIHTFHLQSSGECFASGTNPIVKTEASTSQHVQKFHYPLLSREHQTLHPQVQENDRSKEVEAIKAKIVAHPQYSNLLEAYMDCQKVIS